MPKFVVITNLDAVSDPLKQNAITTAINDKGVGFAHYIPNVWLVADPNGVINPLALRDEIKAIFGAGRSHVMILSGDMKLNGWLSSSEIEWVKGVWDPDSYKISSIKPGP